MFKKEKGIITLWYEGKKPYIININKGICYNQAGKELANIPNNLRTLAEIHRNDNALLKLFYRMGNFWGLNSTLCRVEFKDALAGADKMINAGYITEFDEGEYIYRLIVALSFINQYWNDFVKSWNDGSINSENWMDFERIYKDILIIKKYHLEEYHDQPWMRSLVIYLINDNFSIEQLSHVLFWLRNGAYVYDPYKCFSNMLDIFKWAELRGTSIEKKTHLMPLYAELYTWYKDYENKIKNKAIREHQTKRKLEFEHGNLFVVVPLTVNELSIEGANNRNCVGGYTEENISKNKNVVFIRNINKPNKSLITCDILRNGRINQFLLSHNRHLSDTDTELLRFKEAYQAYLNEIWNDD